MNNTVIGKNIVFYRFHEARNMCEIIHDLSIQTLIKLFLAWLPMYFFVCFEYMCSWLQNKVHYANLNISYPI